MDQSLEFSGNRQWECRWLHVILSFPSPNNHKHERSTSHASPKSAHNTCSRTDRNWKKNLTHKNICMERLGENLSYLRREVNNFKLRSEIRNQAHCKSEHCTTRSKQTVQKCSILSQTLHEGSTLRDRDFWWANSSTLNFLTYSVVDSKGWNLQGHGNDVNSTVEQISLKGLLFFLVIQITVQVGCSHVTF